MRDFIKGVIPEVARKLDWETWLEKFRSCSDQPTALGLLHDIFDTDIGTDLAFGTYEKECERICFILDIADGHSKGGPANQYLIREEAFRVLATKYFKKRKLDSIHNVVLDKLLWFFRPMEHYSQRNVIWIGKSVLNDYPQQLAGEFLEAFLQMIWRDTRYSSETRAEVLGLYYSYNALDKILPSIFPYDWEFFTDDMVAKLEELALRDAATIDEGVLEGKPAARLLLQVRAAKSELARRKRRSELEQTVTEAKNELAQI